jgi:aryl-alcohol dehydrogenase-like predicted oxidoreductase
MHTAIALQLIHQKTLGTRIMKYKTLGKTGLIVSELCLGTMTFGGDGFWKAIGAQDQNEANDLVRGAFDAGVNFFDTADVYANGTSETMLGKAVRDKGLRRDEVVIATKGYGRVSDILPPDASPHATEEAKRRSKVRNISGNSRKHLFDAIDASLKRLKMDHVDLYQIHGQDPLTPIEEVVDTLDAIVKSGRARYVGLCNCAAWHTAKALGIAERKNQASFASMQMYYTIASRELEREVVPLAQSEGLAILPWSPLAGGLLSGKYKRDQAGPNDARRTAFDFPPVNKDRAYDCVEAMEAIATAQGVSVAQIALAWLLHRPWVTSVIIGAKTQDQLSDNLAATHVKLGDEEMALLDQVSALPQEYPGWMLAQQGADRRGGVG